MFTNLIFSRLTPILGGNGNRITYNRGRAIGSGQYVFPGARILIFRPRKDQNL